MELIQIYLFVRFVYLCISPESQNHPIVFLITGHNYGNDAYTKFQVCYKQKGLGIDFNYGGRRL